jgi:hypothetical protein
MNGECANQRHCRFAVVTACATGRPLFYGLGNENPNMPQDKYPTGTDLARLLASLRKSIVFVARLLSKEEERLDHLECECREVLKILGESPAQNLRPHPQTRRANRRPDEQQRILQAQAHQGALAVTIETQPTGAVCAQIDGRAPVPLTPLLAHLLAILITDNETSKDHLIAWKTLAEISCSMAKQTGKQFTKHALSQLICRLKDQFRDHGENKFLIQRNRRFGFRFALRRSTAPVTAGDSR